jgi:hypothetical protein
VMCKTVDSGQWLAICHNGSRGLTSVRLNGSALPCRSQEKV